MEGITRLQYEGKDIILIATAHVSKESVTLVETVIEAEKPDSICIELDQGRYENLKNPKKWEATDVIKVIKQKKAGFLLANLALSSYQKRIAKKLDTKVGQEMIRGMELAEETGAHLVLADRSIQVTFLRVWRKLSMFEKCKLLYSLIFSFDEEEENITSEDLNELLKQDILESVLADMKKEFPKIGAILIHERDQYLASKIKEAPGEKIVAVLGGAHVPGVKEEIYREQNLEEITTVPKKKAIGKIIAWTIPAVIIALLIYSFAVNFTTGLAQLKIWVLWNGVLAAIFTALSLGHPLTILTAFVVAPISSLNPLLACGWFAGMTEAMLRKPSVKDVNNIPDDIFHFKGFMKNRFLRILLIVIMANIGSTIGTIIAGLDIVKNLF